METKPLTIAIYIEDSQFENKDLQNPQLGNPGIGGTPYCFALFLYHYSKLFPEDRLILMHQEPTNIWPAPNGNIVVNDCFEAAKKAKELNANLFLFRFGLDDPSFYSLIDELKLASIGWQHNFFSSNDMKNLLAHPYFRRCVFVGNSQYDRILDHPAKKKCVVIENIVDLVQHPPQPVGNMTNTVVYVGSLTPLKGFDLLAKQWKKILEEVPDAQLLVMGGGKLYSKNIELGEYGLAEKEYEKSFINYLLDDEGKILPSVHFLGIIGTEKYDIFSKCKVGIVNPSGKETLCLAALEMSSVGLPVVSMAKGGTLYSIKNGQTGVLCKNPTKMREAIVQLLQDEKRNLALRQKGPKFVSAHFSPEGICQRWRNVFEDALFCPDQSNLRSSNTRFLLKDKKWAVLINSFLRRVIPSLPPLIERKATRQAKALCTKKDN